jgi:hypothetical protein
MTMKHLKITVIFLTLMSLLKLNAQDTLKKIQIGLEFSYARPSLFKDAVFPSITLSSAKHGVFAGPCVVYYNDEYLRPLWGAQAGYRLFPNGRDKRFDLFFEYNFNLVKGTLKDKFTVGYPEANRTAVLRTINLVSVDNYFGFGFRWNILKDFYIASNVGFNVGLYKQDYTYEYQNGETWTAKGDLEFRRLSERSRIFKVGIGYNLIRIKGKK